MLKLDEYYLELARCNKAFFNETLPNDELQELSRSASEDLKDDFGRFNVLVGLLASGKNKDDVEKVLVEIVALASGIEGLLRNVTDDARDLLRRKYRMEDN